MKLVLTTQRVVHDHDTGERRDALDQAWSRFLHACGLIPVPVPNHAVVATALLDALPVAGIVLTGGGDLVSYGGTTPERDAVENLLWNFAELRQLPVLGVCRGMQFILHRHGARLEESPGHIRTKRHLKFDCHSHSANCYHRLGSRAVPDTIKVETRAEDGVIEAVSAGSRVLGVMWHPERDGPARAEDVNVVRKLFA